MRKKMLKVSLKSANRREPALTQFWQLNVRPVSHALLLVNAQTCGRLLSGRDLETRRTPHGINAQAVRSENFCFYAWGETSLRGRILVTIFTLKRFLKLAFRKWMAGHPKALRFTRSGTSKLNLKIPRGGTNENKLFPYKRRGFSKLIIYVHMQFLTLLMFYSQMDKKIDSCSFSIETISCFRKWKISESTLPFYRKISISNSKDPAWWRLKFANSSSPWLYFDRFRSIRRWLHQSRIVSVSIECQSIFMILYNYHVAHNHVRLKLVSYTSSYGLFTSHTKLCLVHESRRKAKETIRKLFMSFFVLLCSFEKVDAQKRWKFMASFNVMKLSGWTTTSKRISLIS